MKKRIVVLVVLSVHLAISAYAQTTDFFQLVETGTIQDVQGAINNGADVNAQTNEDATVLMIAAQYNQNPEVISIIVKAGADIKAKSKDGSTALMYAARHNQNPEVITTLLNAGADLNAQTKAGNTALMLAARYNPNPGVTMTLLKAGANVYVTNRAGKSAIDYARDNENLKGTDAYSELQENTAGHTSADAFMLRARFDGQLDGNQSATNGSLTSNASVNTGFAISLEALYKVVPFLQIGGGFEYQFARQATLNGINEGNFQFLPVYGMVRIPFTFGPIEPYAVGRIGYGFYSGDSTYTQSGAVTLNSGLYFAVGGGIDCRFGPVSVFAEAAYAVDHGSGTTSFATTNTSFTRLDISAGMSFSL